MLHDVAIGVGDVVKVHLIGLYNFLYLLARDELLEVEDGSDDEVFIR